MYKKVLAAALVVVIGLGTVNYTFAADIKKNAHKTKSSKNSKITANINKAIIKNKKIESNKGKLLLDITYPIVSGITDTKIQAMINTKFKNLALKISNTGKALEKDLQSNTTGAKAVANLNYKVGYNKNDILSVVFINYLYSGGAHGMYTQYSYTFNIKTGQEYKLKDMFKKGINYVSIISKDIQNQNNSKKPAEKIFDLPKTIKADQEFYLSKNGIVIYFNDMPYAVGIPEFTIKYSSLKI